MKNSKNNSIILCFIFFMSLVSVYPTNRTFIANFHPQRVKVCQKVIRNSKKEILSAQSCRVQIFAEVLYHLQFQFRVIVYLLKRCWAMLQLLKCGSSHIIAILVEFRIWGQLDGKMEDISLMMTKEAKQAPGS